MNNFIFKTLARRGENIALSLLIIILFGAAGSVKAQFQKVDASIPSPNAATLGLYGEVPVSLYTGVPNVDIPIYTIDDGKITVPISLSYHASGVRANQHPGWVGLNWNLNAGGSITRVVKGGLDEFAKNGSNNIKGGYYYRNGALADTNWNTRVGMVNILNSKLSGGGLVEYDTEPDEFDFSFLGYSGKFYRNHLGGWQVRSDSDIKIENSPMLALPSGMNLSSADAQETFGGFVLTTGDGMKFYFGGNTSSIEYTTLFFEQKIDIWIANTWHLTKIEAPEGYSVIFNYAPQSEGKFIASFSNSFEGGSTRIDVPWNYSFSTISSVNQYSGSLIRPVYLSKITFSKGYIDFTRSNTTELKYPSRVIETFVDFIGTSAGQVNFSDVKWLTDAFIYLTPGGHLGWPSNLKSQIPLIIDKLVWQKLDNITVKQRDNKVIQRIDFDYNNNSTQRLMLKNLSFSKDNCKNNYKFSYHNAGNLPEYFDEYDQTDHWGFYNGNTAFKYKDIGANLSNYFNHKQPSTNINILNAGSLDTLTYPTGGFTKFTYEPHTIYKYKIVNSDGSLGLTNANGQNIGGIRVKEIEHFDGQKSAKKTYTYMWNGGSSGIGSGLHQYFMTSVQEYVNIQGTSMGTYTKNILSVNNTLPMSTNSLGSHIGYRRVRETNSDGSYTIYNYTNFESDDKTHMDEWILPANKFGSSGNIYDPQIDKSVERGKLLSQEDYDANGIVSKKTISYKKISDGFVRAAKVNSYQFAVGTNNPIVSYIGIPYGYHTYQYKADTVTLYTYDATDRNRFVRDLTVNSYNNIGLLSQSESHRGNQKTKTINKYTYDYLIPSNPTGEYAASINTMKTIGMNDVVVEQQIWNNENGSYGLVDGNVNLFRRYNAAAQFTNVQIEKTYRLASIVPVASIDISEVKTVGFTYDNAKYSNLVLDFGSDNAAGYTQRGEPKQYKESNGIWTYFNWNEGDRAGLIQSKRVGNHETTFDYTDPLVGVSRINNLNLGTFTDYIYDDFNRLEAIKDYRGNLIQSYTYNLKNSTGCDAKPSLIPSAILDPVPDTDDDCVAPSKPMITRTGSNTTVCLSTGQTVNLTSNGSGTIKWYRDGAEVASGTSISYTVTVPGSYTTTSMVTSGCPSASSDAFVVSQTSGCTGGNCVVNKVKLAFRSPGDCCMDRLNGAKLQGSNNGGSSWTDIYTFSANGTGSYQEFTFSNSTSYTSLRFVASSTGWGELAELEFYNGTTKLTGTAFGTGNYGLAFDNSLSTKWEGSSVGNSNVAGLNLTSCGGLNPPLVQKTSGTTACVASNQKVVLTASNCSGSITWFRGTTQVGTGVTLETNVPGNYTAKCTVGSQTSESAVFNVGETSGCGVVGNCLVNKVKLVFRSPSDC
ncbi:hypothetical protein LZD49_34650, partial [Dyadobacter sp. CY261]|uniref:galactose-binding domain-containing protein n=1 Tax=Dyadobacter sp. CY261 TaxID=2907203 RepID=UPI001F2422D0